MRRILCIATMLLFAAPFAFAQEASLNHVELGVFAHYFRFSPTEANFLGLGARLGVNATRNFQIEVEGSYDFNQAFAETYTNGSGGAGGTFSTARTGLRILHLLIGPKIQTSGPARLFVTVKGGIINFRFDPTKSVFSGLTSSVSGLRDNNVRGVLYPGGGFEAFIGPIGIRLDAGDEIYFLNGAHNNLAASIGPTFRF